MAKERSDSVKDKQDQIVRGIVEVLADPETLQALNEAIGQTVEKAESLTVAVTRSNAKRRIVREKPQLPVVAEDIRMLARAATVNSKVLTAGEKLLRETLIPPPTYTAEQMAAVEEWIGPDKIQRLYSLAHWRQRLMTSRQYGELKVRARPVATPFDVSVAAARVLPELVSDAKAAKSERMQEFERTPDSKSILIMLQAMQEAQDFIRAHHGQVDAKLAAYSKGLQGFLQTRDPSSLRSSLPDLEAAEKLLKETLDRYGLSQSLFTTTVVASNVALSRPVVMTELTENLARTRTAIGAALLAQATAHLDYAVISGAALRMGDELVSYYNQATTAANLDKARAVVGNTLLALPERIQNQGKPDEAIKALNSQLENDSKD